MTDDSTRMRTPSEWAWMQGMEVIDPAGWNVDKRNFDSTCSREEFERRLTTSTTSPMSELPMIPSFTDDSTKKNIEEHLRTKHARFGWINSKSSKNEMLRFHESFHGVGSNGYQDYRHTPEDKHHQHISIDINIIDNLGVPMTDIDADRTKIITDKALAQAGEGKPLNATQRKSLQTLIDNDFAVLTGQMRQFAADMQKEKQDEVNADYTEREQKATEYTVSLRVLRNKQADVQTALTRKHLDELHEFDANLDDGFSRDGSTLSGTVYAKGKKEAIKVANTDVVRDLNKALTEAERQRLSAQRTVLLASVTPQALDLLDTIPSARDLMLRAAADQSQVALAVDGGSDK